MAFRPGSHASESESTPSVIVSTWKDLSTPSEIHLKLDNPIDLTGHLLSPFFVREFHYQGCRFHSIAHLMCYRYAIIHDLKLFATSIRKWSRHLTDFPTNYVAPCTGPRPFDLQCSTPWGAFHDTPGARGTLVSDILIELSIPPHIYMYIYVTFQDIKVPAEMVCLY